MARPSALLVAAAAMAAAVAEAQERPEGTNRLYHETSPYLQLHARNPVDWYPWGDEAIELARRLDRPIFLSIGYSTCYWCHRMEEDVFENAAIAKLMNEGFVNIKVDREERPDLDEIYMTATQLITRRGGWPNSVFLTPDLAPFFAGTYFPPEDRGGLVGFPTILARVTELWTNERSGLLESASRVADAVTQTLSARGAPAADVPGMDGIGAGLASLRDSYDEPWGGFGSAPKFPSPANLFLLLSLAETGDAEARRMLTGTLHRMAEGALYDHVGGGFHRYATDARFRVPHFEKMLYDNAFLAELLVDTARLTGDDELARYARGTLDFVLEEMTNEHGAFKSAIDAQTDGHEGAYYVWSREELDDALDPDQVELLSDLFGFGQEPNFEETHYTVYLTGSLPELAASREETADELLARVAPALERLRSRRAERKAPLTDDKVLTDWNGMMIQAFAKAGSYFDEPRYSDAAARAAGFVLERLRSADGTLQHAWRNGQSKVDAFLDDYAFLMRSLVTLHRESVGESPAKWLAAAEELAGELESRLRDPAGGYFLSARDPLNLVRTKAVTDGAIPSGNAVVVDTLLELSTLTGEPAYAERAEASMRAFATIHAQLPSATKTLAVAIARYHEERDPNALAKSVVGATLQREGERFAVDVAIRPGWHINANPASSNTLIATEVAGAVAEVSYPEGETLELSFADEGVAVYSGRVRLTGRLRERGGTVRLIYQACDDTRCLAPVERELP